MSTYVISILLSCFICFVSKNIKISYAGLNGKRNINIAYGVILIETILMVFTINNPDYEVYKRAFYYNDGPFGETGIRLVSGILKSIGLYNYSFFLIMICALIYFTFSRWEKEVEDIWIVLLCYSLFIMFYDVIQLRNTISFFLVLLGLYYGLKEKKIICILLLIIAVFFHSFALLTGLIAAYVALIQPQKNTRNIFLHFVKAIVQGMVVTIIAPMIITWIVTKVSFLQKLSFYITKEISFDSLIIWGGYGVVLVIIVSLVGIRPLYNNLQLEKNDDKLKIVNALYQYSLFLISLSGFLLYIDEFNRLYRSCYLIVYLLLGAVYKYIDKKNRAILISMIIVVNLIFMAVAIMRGVNFDGYW